MTVPRRPAAVVTASLVVSLALDTSAGTTPGPLTPERLGHEAAAGIGRPVPDSPHFRAASVTKSLVAATVLRLSAERRRLSLHDTVEHWLPGRVRGHGNDGSRITVRHLLQYTSGLHRTPRAHRPDALRALTTLQDSRSTARTRS